MAIDLGMPVNTLVTPALHPQMVASLEEFDEDTKSTLGPVVEAFDIAYHSIAQVFAAREAVQSDPTLTEAAQILKAAGFGDTMMKRAATTFDKVSANLKQTISTYEKSLSEPVAARAVQLIAQEIRAHVKAMDAGKRNYHAQRGAKWQLI